MQPEKDETDDNSLDIETNTSTAINVLCKHPYDEDVIYAGTSRGVLISRNKGKNWEWLYSYGLINDNIKHILITGTADTHTDIYVATEGGAYCYNAARQAWVELYEGLTTKDVRFLASSAQQPDNIWTATAAGVFKRESVVNSNNYNNEQPQRNSFPTFACEPTIHQVQTAAIEYAEVYPEKIQNWRKQARIKALLPEFSLDYDKTVTYDSGIDRYQIGPKDWGFGFKWDIGDLVYSDDQTNIDVRSKLMVQLRDDVLDEVNRLYFERRRLKMNLEFSPPQDTKSKQEKELRLQEVTASIDALTGGYFSRNIK